MDETSARLACHLLSLSINGLSSALTQFDSALSIFEKDLPDLKPYFTERDQNKVKRWVSLKTDEQDSQLSAWKRELSDQNIKLLAICDSIYPALLRELADPPPIIYICGEPEKLSSAQIAIVGSRGMTPVGGKLARQFAYEIGSAGMVITSGLALGIDACAHRGALDAKANTIAVLGTGINVRYPRNNNHLYDEILESGGVLVSEYPLGTPPRPGNFPRRNRIITGLSMGTLVVEASERSGSLVSARLAAEQGREVFVIPGNVQSPVSAGCHRLIREGATLVTEPEHVLEDLRPMLETVLETAPLEPNSLSESEPTERHWLLDALGHEILPVDELCDRCDKPVQDVTSAITELELSGAIQGSAFGYQRMR